MALPLALSAQAAAARAPAVDTLIAAAGLPAVLGGVEVVLDRQIGRLAPGLDPEEGERLREALAKHFAPTRLLESVAERLAADPENVSAVAAWLTSGPVAEARAAAASYLPSAPLEIYAGTLADAPPSSERIGVMLRLARAQGAGPFFLTLSESLRGAAHVTLNAVAPDTPSFQGLPDEQATRILEAHDQQTVLLFLHRYEPLPDELVARWAAAYESPSGEWYVDALAGAVRDAVLAAAEAAAAELRGASLDVAATAGRATRG